MSMRRYGIVTIVLALFARIFSIPLSHFRINPYSQADVYHYETTAIEIADALRSGVVIAQDLTWSGYTFKIWGYMLAPFWLIPGPSLEYARIANCLLGTIAAYNVYAVGKQLKSPRAGFIAALPMALLPTHVLLHSSIMREAPIHFALTSATRAATAPSWNYGAFSRGGYVISFLTVASLLRPDNIPIYLVAALTYISVYLVHKDHLSSSQVFGVSIIPILIALSLYGQGIVRKLSQIRNTRTQGRAVYLPGIYPESVLQAISFSWIGAVYFLFAPFPWMLNTLSDLVVYSESIVRFVFVVVSLLGARQALQRKPAVVSAIFVASILAVVLYSLATANYGAASRYRQMIIWVFFILGAIWVDSILE
jgi:4-amino-4-deoxy-L-arabinose transferase-like glycosyltransferase